MHGGSRSDWERAREEFSPESCAKEAVKACPPKTAETMVRWACEWENRREEIPKAGVCADPDEQAAWETTRRWLKEWKGQPEAPTQNGE